MDMWCFLFVVYFSFVDVDRCCSGDGLESLQILR